MFFHHQPGKQNHRRHPQANNLNGIHGLGPGGLDSWDPPMSHRENEEGGPLGWRAPSCLAAL